MLLRVRGSTSSCSLAATRDPGPQVYMLSRKVILSFQHVTDVHKPSVGVRDGCSHVFAPRPPYQVSQIQSAASPRYSCFIPCPPLCLLGLVYVHGLLPLRNYWPPPSCHLSLKVYTQLRSTVISLIYPRQYFDGVERSLAGRSISLPDCYPKPIVSPVGSPLFVFYGAVRVS